MQLLIEGFILPSKASVSVVKDQGTVVVGLRKGNSDEGEASESSESEDPEPSGDEAASEVSIKKRSRSDLDKEPDADSQDISKCLG